MCLSAEILVCHGIATITDVLTTNKFLWYGSSVSTWRERTGLLLSSEVARQVAVDEEGQCWCWDEGQQEAVTNGCLEVLFRFPRLLAAMTTDSKPDEIMERGGS